MTIMQYARLAGVIAVVLAILGVSVWIHRDGRNKERLLHQAAAARELEAANKEIVRANDAAREKEKLFLESITAASRKYNEEVAKLEKDYATKIAAIRAGSLRLRDPGANVQTVCRAAPETAAGISGRDATARSELSAEASQFLLDEAFRADRIVEQLTACQAIVKADRE